MLLFLTKEVICGDTVGNSVCVQSWISTDFCGDLMTTIWNCGYTTSSALWKSHQHVTQTLSAREMIQCQHCQQVIQSVSTWHRQCLYCIDVFPILTAFHCGTTTTTPQPFYGPFSGTTRVSRCQKRTLDFMAQEKINRGRHIDHPAGRHSIQTSQRPPPPSLIVAHTRRFTSHFPSDPSWAGW